jgi:hypothetical protein
MHEGKSSAMLVWRLNFREIAKIRSFLLPEIMLICVTHHMSQCRCGMKCIFWTLKAGTHKNRHPGTLGKNITKQGSYSGHNRNQHSNVPCSP